MFAGKIGQHEAKGLICRNKAVKAYSKLWMLKICCVLEFTLPSSSTRKEVESTEKQDCTLFGFFLDLYFNVKASFYIDNLNDAL